jgi:septal ring factor EnvC (AmiA/AmiB activator)
MTWVLMLAAGRYLAAQTVDQTLRAQQDSLDRIRSERDALERQAATLRSTVTDISAELDNLRSRATATARIVTGLATQLATISAETDRANAAMTRAEEELTAKQDALRRHLVEIYKRGPLFTEQVLLSAHSFGELVARYKYLHTLALRDRSLVDQVQQLRNQVAMERNRLETLKDQLAINRQEKTREEARLLQLQHDQGATLSKVKQQQQEVDARIAKYNQTITRMASTIAALDAARKRSEAAHPNVPKASSTIATSDYGKLDWPVEGDLIYTFGKAQTASNTTIRWNGIGIKAPLNTAVRAVAGGTVVSVGQFGTYGLTVIVDHGGGDYSIYGSLSRADVKLNQVIAKGASIGGAGISDPDFPAHLHFEIRTGSKNPAAVDPITWLKGRR